MADDGNFRADANENIRLLDRIAKNAKEQAEKFSSVRQEVDRLSVTEESSSDGVRVTVSASGAVTGIAMTERVRGQEPDRIASAVLRAIQRAQSRIADEVQGVVNRNVGEDNDTARNVVASFRNRFPEPPPPEGPVPGGAPERPRIDAIEDDEPPSQPPQPPQPPRAPRRSDVDDDFGGRSFLG